MPTDTEPRKGKRIICICLHRRVHRMRFADIASPLAEETPKTTPKKEAKDKANGTIKLKKAPPKHSKPGNWKDGSVIDGEPRPVAAEPTAVVRVWTCDN